MTYAELGDPPERAAGPGRRRPGVQRPRPAAELQSELTDGHRASGRRLFKGETLRGLLLTSYGFSVFGVKGAQVATVAYVVAALLALLSIAGFAHASRPRRPRPSQHPSGLPGRTRTRWSSASEAGPRRPGGDPYGSAARSRDAPASSSPSGWSITGTTDSSSNRITGIARMGTASMAHERDQAGDERDEAGTQRDQSAERRDQAGDRRDQSADRRDDAADRRDQAADRRDDAADRRDQAAERSEAGAGIAADALSAGGTKGSVVRPAAGIAGPPGGRQRTHVRREPDRDISLADRGAGASERTQAELDRDTSQADRGGVGEEGERERTTSVDGSDPVCTSGATGRGLELEREMARARRDDQPLALAFVDVDRLKDINDSRGHAAGDRMLLSVADTFRANLRSYDLIIRYGGDEFVCAMSGLSIADASERLALVNALLAEAPEHGSVTVGLAELRPDDSAEDLVGRADAELYRQPRGRPLLTATSRAPRRVLRRSADR